MGERTSILFLCTGNSARSIVAEALANGRHGDRLRALSAGSHPRGRVNDLALDTLRRHGIDTAGLRSKSWDEVRDDAFDVVLTLCDEAAAETCPTFPGAPVRDHWSLPDPPASDDPAATFELVFATLDSALGSLAGDGSIEERLAAGAVAVRESLCL